MDGWFTEQCWKSTYILAPRLLLGHSGIITSSLYLHGWFVSQCQGECNIPFQHLNDSVYSLHEPVEPKAEFVFFHGYRTKACEDMHTRAWKSSSGDCWPGAWLQDEDGFPRARILSVKYDSSLHKLGAAGVYTMEHLTEALATELILLETGNVGQTGLPVVLIGHNLGGLVIKALCVYLQSNCSLNTGRRETKGPEERSRKFERFLGNVKGIFYFATPHQGLEFVDDARIHLDEELVSSLKIFNPVTSKLNDDFRKLRSCRQWKTAGLGPLIVDPKSFVRCSEASVRNDTDVFMMVPESMESINKPVSPSSSTFQFFVSSLRTFVGTEIDEDSDDEFKNFMNLNVGMEAAVEKVVSIFSSLQKAKGGTNAVVLHGMAGIGKSTLGKAVFLKLSKYFDPDCRCSVDREAISNPQRTISALQQSILECLGSSGRLAADSKQVRRRLCTCYKDARRAKRSLLIFIDNIENDEELEDIFPEGIDDLLPKGSHVVVTSRNLGMCM